MADEFYGVEDGKRFYPLHACGYTPAWNSDTLTSRNSNFVADTKYLYRLARYYYDSPSVEYADTYANYNAVTKAGANYSILQKIVFGGTIYTNPLVHYLDSRGDVSNVTVKGIVNMNILNNYTESDTTSRAFKILGLALHLAGDTYAHRVRVPLSSAETGGCFATNPGGGTFPYSHTSAYNATTMNAYLKERTGNPCRCFNCFKQAVQSGHVEFRDVNHFMEDANGNIANSAYKADNTTFYPKRYTIGTAVAVNTMVTRFINQQDFTIFVFLPSDTNYTLKLNCLKQYVIDTGTNWDGLQQSTRDRVIALSTGALV
jgi:hypothetical protein